MNEITIYSPFLHNRLSYVLQFIESNYDLRFYLENHIERYKTRPGPCINYTNTAIKENELKIYQSENLYKAVSDLKNPQARRNRNCLEIFPDEQSPDFDILAAIFWLLARVEEYGQFLPDRHQRFPAKESLLCKENSLHIPLIDLWLHHWVEKLNSKFDLEIKQKERKFTWSMGIDIDQMWKHKYKPIHKTIGRLLINLFQMKFQESWRMISQLSNDKKDVYDQFDKIRTYQIPNENLIFFILSGGNSAFDKNHSLKIAKVKSVLEKLKTMGRIGLHPSYHSVDDLQYIVSEKKNLENAIDQEIIISRQHYIRLKLPNTYQLLLKAGIKEDFTMGYPDEIGFRAGTCRPHFWYDLENENQTDLQLFPFVAMDRTYLDYVKMKPESVIQSIQEMYRETLKYNGHFHVVWHNSSFDFEEEWKGWEKVFPEVITELLKK